MTRMRSPALAVTPSPSLLPLMMLVILKAPAHAFQVSSRRPLGLLRSSRPLPLVRADWVRTVDTCTVSSDHGKGRAWAFTSWAASNPRSGPMHANHRSDGDSAKSDAIDAMAEVFTSEQQPPRMSHPATDEELSAMDEWLSAKMRAEGEGGGLVGTENNRISTTTTSNEPSPPPSISPPPPRMSSPATDEELSALDEWLTADEDGDRIWRYRISHDGQSSSSSSSLEFDDETASPLDSSPATDDHVVEGRGEAAGSSASASASASAASNHPPPKPKKSPTPPRDDRGGDGMSEEDDIFRRRRRVLAYSHRTCAAAYAAACSASLSMLSMSPRSAYAAAGPFLASGLSHILACEAAACDGEDRNGSGQSKEVFEGLNLGLGVYAAVGISAAILTPQNRNPFWITPCILSIFSSLLGYRYGLNALDQTETAMHPLRSVVRSLRAGLAKVPGCNLKSRTYLAAAFATGCMALAKLWETVALVLLGPCGADRAIIAGRLLRCAKLGLLTAVTLTLGGAAAADADRGDSGTMGVSALATLNLLASVGFGTLAAFLFSETSPLATRIGGCAAAAFALFSALDGVTSSRKRSERRRSSSSKF